LTGETAKPNHHGETRWASAGMKMPASIQPTGSVPVREIDKEHTAQMTNGSQNGSRGDADNPAPSAMVRQMPATARNGRVALAAAGFAALMLGAAYAAVPIYKLICQATGLGGTTQRADRAPGAIGEKKIRVRFNATVSSGLPWNFKAVQGIMDVIPGEPVLAHYEAANRSVNTTKGTATFNVTPEIAGKYFSKIECFCFIEQELAGGQKAGMPVTFFIDPAMLADKDAAGVEEITLSYTFFATPGAARGWVAQGTNNRLQ
jgi:cytochrome c oxidase assembly protein subunit 11